MGREADRNSPPRRLAAATQVGPTNGSSGLDAPSKLRVRMAFAEEQARGRNGNQLPGPGPREAEERAAGHYI